ncbi:MAG: hypothetical protein Q7S57_06235 [bacterium]|nr:hypothetical protein [bacterium]
MFILLMATVLGTNGLAPISGQNEMRVALGMSVVRSVDGEMITFRLPKEAKLTRYDEETVMISHPRVPGLILLQRYDHGEFRWRLIGIKAEDGKIASGWVAVNEQILRDELRFLDTLKESVDQNR